jgi:hypothetical protein
MARNVAVERRDRGSRVGQSFHDLCEFNAKDFAVSWRDRVSLRCFFYNARLLPLDFYFLWTLTGSEMVACSSA